MRGTAIAGIQERSRTFLQRCVSSGTQAHDIFVRQLPGPLSAGHANMQTCLDGFVSMEPTRMAARLADMRATALHAYACDCVTHHIFHPHGTNCLQDAADQEMMHQVAADDSLQSTPAPIQAFVAATPATLTMTADRLLQIADRLISYYSPTFHRLSSSVLYFFATPRQTPLADSYVLETSKKPGAASFTLISRLGEKASTDLDATDAAAECLDHMVAGIDTTGDGLCFLMWELSQPRNLEIQRRLQRELRQNRDVPIDQLPYLDGVVSEGLRLFPPIPMSLPRLVPEGGRIIDDVFLPEGTVVSCQAYSVHRVNTNVFPEPQKFNPERWLEEDGDTERRRLMFAFSNGGRGCVGKQ